MLEINYVKNYTAKTIQGLVKRGIQNAKETVANIVNIDEQRRTTQALLEAANSELNQFSKNINILMKKELDPQKIEIIKTGANSLKEKVKELNTQLKKHEAFLQKALCQLPNLPHDGVPTGVDATNNEIIYQSPSIPATDTSKLPHWELVQKHAIVDFELGSKITGAGFPVYKGKGAKLQRALINFFLDNAIQVGYEEIQPPILVNEASAYATGQLPDKEEQMYQISNAPFYLIPTAEVPITNIYRNCIINKKELPIKNVGYTPCFRREAGSWGSHVRGLNRLHQFDKVELIQISHPATSYTVLEKMKEYVVQLVQKLDLPYRIVKLCSGDLGFTAAMTYDIEVFSAAQQQWLEVSSVSNFETFQANRMGLRYRDSDKKTKLLHTLNGSALALPRIMAALLENNQTSKGINIPVVLRPYTGFNAI